MMSSTAGRPVKTQTPVGAPGLPGGNITQGQLEGLEPRLDLFQVGAGRTRPGRAHPALEGAALFVVVGRLAEKRGDRFKTQQVGADIAVEPRLGLGEEICLNFREQSRNIFLEGFSRAEVPTGPFRLHRACRGGSS